MNDTFDGIVGILLLIACFFAGKKVGHSQASTEHLFREQERDINLLRQEIAELKQQARISQRS